MPSAAFPVDYHQLFRSLPDNFLLIAPDAEATIVDNTDSHVAASMKPRAEAVGKPFFEAYPAADEESARIVRESHAHVRRHREPHTMPLIRYDLARPAGQGGGLEEMYWEATHFPVLNEAGQLAFILQRTRNVTERHQAALRAAEAQQALNETQNRMRFLLESLPILVWTARPDGVRDYFNPRWLEFTGRPVEQSLNKGWQQAVHPDDRERVVGRWEEAIAAGQPFQIEYRLRRHDGHYRWLLMRGLPRHDERGQLTMWVGAGTDIHDQKLLVQELLEANEQQAALSDQAYQAQAEAQRQRETLYNLFMEAPAIISIARGPEYRHEFVNPLYQQLFPGRELLGRTVKEVIPEAESQGFIALLDHVYQTGEPFHGTEVPFVATDPVSGASEERFFNVTYQPLREKGRIVGISHFSYDVTELVNARRALEHPGSDA
ncbi:PAS domain-containing protein [Hymenobacter rubripertinctus]|uniref:histidine kinase n=1 Tax=Hymenobacter rubripertinctus TaxID=2029981 RepID=A0A418R004_9BACT|nr:PAS domain-containing protein [Hymenobacter rubripertinctus]RIY10780.1 PAS domain S-box protein [Hymenobacter rubripertinctus]